MAKEISLKEDSFQAKFDSKLNKIVSDTFDVGDDAANVILAHHELVSPAYLVEIQINLSLNAMIEELLPPGLTIKPISNEVENEKSVSVEDLIAKVEKGLSENLDN